MRKLLNLQHAAVVLTVVVASAWPLMGADLPATQQAGSGPINSDDRDAYEHASARIKQESFEESVVQLIDWERNYRSGGNAQGLPAAPESVDKIITSRRFIKLLNDVHSPQADANCRVLRDRVLADLDQWQKLYAAGQRPYGDSDLGGPNYNSEKLIIPLTYRLNACLLLLAQHPQPELLSATLAYVDRLKEDTNWALAGFAVGQVFNSMPPEGLNGEQKRLIDQYQQRKNDPQSGKFISPRAAKTADGTILSLPARYVVYVNQDRSNGAYFDPSGVSNQLIVEIGRQMFKLQH